MLLSISQYTVKLTFYLQDYIGLQTALSSVKQCLKCAKGSKDEYHKSTGSSDSTVNNFQEKKFAKHCDSNNITALEKIFMYVGAILQH